MDTRSRETFDWNDELLNDESEYVLLPEGDYVYTITGFEKGTFEGSLKIPACNRALLTFRVDTEEGKIAYVSESLLLARRLEWKLSDFFRSIGMKKKGEPFVMDWGCIVGARGIGHFRPRKYTDNEGIEREVNSLDHYIDYDPAVLEADTELFYEAEDFGQDGCPVA